MIILSLVYTFFLQLLANPYSSWTNEKSEQALKSGMKAVFEYDLNTAEEHFSKLTEYEPERPEGYYYKSYVYFWKYFIGEMKKDYDSFIALNDDAIRQAEAYLDREKGISVREAIAYFFLGESYTYRAAVEARKGNFISAGWNGTKARKAYEEALTRKPDFHDAIKGKGMFQFVISLIPGSLRWIVEALGYEGDRYGGLQLMIDAKNKGYYVAKEMEFYLTVIDFYFFKKREESEATFLRLLKDSPTSSIYLYSLGYLYYSRASFEQSTPVFEKCIENLKRDPEDAFATLSLYMLGETHFYRCEFEKALGYFTKSERVRQIEFFMARTHFAIGVCYEMLKNRPKAIEFFLACKVRIDVVSGEIYAKRKSREYATSPMSDIQKKLLILSHHISLGKYDLVQQIVDELAKVRLSKDEEAEYYYNKGRFLKSIGKTNESIEVFNKVASMFPPKERQFPPLSRFELGKIYMSLEKYELAEEEFKRADRYSAYDYEVTVRRDISLTRDVLRSKTGK